MIETITRSTRLDTKGIKTALKKYGYTQKAFYISIAEYIWNGFDAGATKISVDYEISQNKKEGNFRKLVISDNGKGIDHSKLNIKFEPIFDSEKLNFSKWDKQLSAVHGKNGIGRLTFFNFANHAIWSTIYKKEGKKYEYRMSIDSNKLNKISEINKLPKEVIKDTGTIVMFQRFEKLKLHEIENDLINYLRKEFGWFIELNQFKKINLKINGKDLDYSGLIEDSSEFIIETQEVKVQVKYIKWKCLLNKEYSKFYYLNENHKEKHKETTKLNNQGDDFHHSVFLVSNYFEDFNFKSKEDSKQKQISGGARADDKFTDIMDKVYSFLRSKRKPFLKKHSSKIIKEYKKEGILQSPKKGTFEEIESQDLEGVFKELYEIQPKFFLKLKKEQKKIFVGLLNNILKSENRSQLLELINEIVKLTEEERKEFSEILKVTSLTKIINTMNLLRNRYRNVEILKQLVFRKDLNATERDHIQKIVEDNYWLFGESYHLVTKDVTLQRSLEEYIYLLDGLKKKPKFEGKDKNKRLDIFICQKQKVGEMFNNIVVELKSPKVKLGRDQCNQVDDYRKAILAEPQFKTNHTNWIFILVGTDFSTDGHINDQIKNSINHGKKNLIFKADNFEVYVKLWADIFVEFELNYNFLNSELQLKKENLVKKLDSASEGVKIALEKK